MMRAGPLALLLAVGCSTPPLQPGQSVVRLRYPRVEGASTLQELRVQWGVDKWALVTVEPGDDMAAVMNPHGGGGPMFVRFIIDGRHAVWNGSVGTDGDGKSYGVEIDVDPMGAINVKHCEHPCGASVPSWRQPWKNRAQGFRHALGI
jgi:hypothetical protein